MFDFLARLFRTEPSGVKAKERLRLVLLSDHLALSPDIVESLKTDLLEVISRYVEVDIQHVDVTFEQRENEVAMLANVPILSMKNGRPHSQDARVDPAAGPLHFVAAPPALLATPGEAPRAIDEVPPAGDAEVPPTQAADATGAALGGTALPLETAPLVEHVATQPPAPRAKPSRTRKRRRRKSTASTVAAVATTPAEYTSPPPA